MASSDKPVIVQGIKINADKEVFDDFEFTELLADSQSGDNIRQLQAVVGMLRFTFGDDWESIRDQLRKKHNGKLTNEIVMDFFGEVMEAFNSKN